MVADDRSEYPARVSVGGGGVEPLVKGKMVISAMDQGRDGKLAVLAATDSKSAEVHALEAGALRVLTHQNDAVLAGFKLGATEEFSCTAKDGNEVHGLIVKPPDYEQGKRYPTLLRIHGGPNSRISTRSISSGNCSPRMATWWWRGELPGQLGPRPRLSEDHCGRLGQQGSARLAGGRRPRSSRSGWPTRTASAWAAGATAAS